jgi:enamine deaminase RidA (YjgF/YER057c/UK114 family)
MKRIDSNSRRSRAIVAGNIVFLGGQVADDRRPDIRVQTREALAKVDDLLAQCGSSREKLASVTIWLKSMDDYDGMNEIWDGWIDPANPPTRACGEVRMAYDDLLVEIIATAVV